MAISVEHTLGGTLGLVPVVGGIEDMWMDSGP